MKYIYLWWFSILLLTGCSVLRPIAEFPSEIYWLTPSINVVVEQPQLEQVLRVNKPSAPIAMQSIHLLYKQGYHLNRWPNRRWAAPPHELFGLFLAEGFRKSRVYQAVLDQPAAVTADWQLDTQLLAMYQDIEGPVNRIYFRVHWVLTHNRSKKIVAANTVQHVVPVNTIKGSADIQAMNQAMSSVIESIVNKVIQLTQSF